MEKEKKKKLIILTLILLVVIGGVFIFSVIRNNNTGENENDSSDITTIEVENREEIEIEPGDLVISDRSLVEFYIPKGWSHSISMDENLNEYISISGGDLVLLIEYLPVDKDYLWTDREQVEYSTSSGRLYKEDGSYKVAMNMTSSIEDQNFATGETTEKYYGMFITIKKAGNSVSQLSDLEFAQIKFIMDGLSN